MVIMKYNNLTIIGTSHIAKQSLDEVEKAIEEEKPGIILHNTFWKAREPLFEWTISSLLHHERGMFRN